MIAKLILIVHVLIAVVLVGLVLLQQGKGADMGASFGAGSSNTLFGSAGNAGFLVKLTALLAAVFFVTSFGLAMLAKSSMARGPQIDLPAIEQSVPASGPVPAPAVPSAGTPVPAPAAP